MDSPPRDCSILPYLNLLKGKIECGAGGGSEAPWRFLFRNESYSPCCQECWPRQSSAASSLLGWPQQKTAALLKVRLPSQGSLHQWMPGPCATTWCKSEGPFQLRRLRWSLGLYAKAHFMSAHPCFLPLFPIGWAPRVLPEKTPCKANLCLKVCFLGRPTCYKLQSYSLSKLGTCWVYFQVQFLREKGSNYHVSILL